MNTWKVILATLVIFTAGLVTGGLLVRYSQHTVNAHRPRFTGEVRTSAVASNSAGGMRLEFLRRAQRDLDLSPEQRERIDKLLKEAQERTHKIMEPINPELRRELQRTRDEFRSVLDQAQQARFDELVKHQQRPRESHRSNEPSVVTNTP